MVKKLGLVLLLAFFCSLPAKAQFSESKERKKMWHKSKKRRKNREAFNPYLEKKEKESQKLGKQNARDLKRQEKQAIKQKKRSMKKLGYKPTKVKRAK
jgi:hypothetical protein